MLIEMSIEERIPFCDSLFETPYNCFYGNKVDAVFVKQEPNDFPCENVNGDFQTYTELTSPHRSTSSPISPQYNDSASYFRTGDVSDSLGLQADNLQIMEAMVFAEVWKDVQTTCMALNIPREPLHWTVDHVCRWVSAILMRYNLPPCGHQFAMSGFSLCSMPEEEFISRSGASGSTLYAQLEIWRNASNLVPTKKQPSCDESMEWSNHSDSLHSDTSDQSLDHSTACRPSCKSPALSTRSLSSTSQTLSDSEDGTASESESSTDGPDGSSKALQKSRCKRIIHLWQFLLELLRTPGMDSYIKWLDEEQGVFKIVDSAKVAELWGKRKNRPAMNYDKLSRSVRQYYKKGIVKKTAQSKRLVYQFCKDYMT